MDERARRVSENEVLFRAVNEQIETLNEQLGSRGDPMTVVCECWSAECVERLQIQASSYEQVRRDATRFVVAPGHVVEDMETVVERGDGYEVVAKREGEPAEYAIESDRRR